MQGFPIGGSRIRLSWGRSQYKAAQAVVQQAQLQAQLQAQQVQPLPAQPPPFSVSSIPAAQLPSSQTTPKNTSNGSSSITAQLTPQQALELLAMYGLNRPLPNISGHQTMPSAESAPFSPLDSQTNYNPGIHNGFSQDMSHLNSLSRGDVHGQSRGSFSPFEQQNEVLSSQSHHHLFNRAPGFGPSISLPADLKLPNGTRDSAPSAASGSPRSASTRTLFSNGDSSYNQYFDSGSRAHYLNVADILRQDSQAMPRNPGQQTSPGSSFPDVTEKVGKAGDVHNIDGMFKNLKLDALEGINRGDHPKSVLTEIRQTKESTASPHPADID